jgi:CBS domain-containing protein
VTSARKGSAIPSAAALERTRAASCGFLVRDLGCADLHRVAGGPQAHATGRLQETTMKQVADVMTEEVYAVEPQETLRRAAELMATFDVGSLPVCSDQRVLGIVTDRDIVVRGLASGLDPETGCVSDAMTHDVLCCTPQQDLAQAMQLMADHQVRRLPVVDAERRLVGIVSIGDLAVEEPDEVGPTVSAISADEGDREHR